MSGLLHVARQAIWIVALCTAHGARAAPVSLPAFGAELAQTSVSGLSAGAYMAVQMHVAHASIMQGAGVFAGGPYHCAEGSLFTAQTRCMRPSLLFPAPQAADIARLAALTRERGRAGLIDDPAQLARQKAWIFVGAADDVVKPAVVDALAAFYRHFMPAAHIAYRSDLATFHNQVVLEGDRRVQPCHYKNRSALHDAYVNDCDFDAAGALLQHIYGPLAARNGGAPAGRFIEFDQTEFLTAARSQGMDDSGWVYVPASCEAGARCRVHVAFHGCFQYAEHVHDAYIRNSGINQWADTNAIIVLYPQTVSIALRNPNGCFDWWGYTSPQAYDTRDGVQVAAVRRMIDRLAGAPVARGAEQLRVFASRGAENGCVSAGPGGAHARPAPPGSLAVGLAADGRASRALLSFDTSAIPPDARVTRAFVTVRQQARVGEPWHGRRAIIVDLRRGAFGRSPATDGADWADPPSAAFVAAIAPFDGSARSGQFSAEGLAAIGRGRGALTQLRLQFPDSQSRAGQVRIMGGADATLSVAYR